MKDVVGVGAAIIGVVLFIMVIGFITGSGNLLWQSYAQPKSIEITRRSNQESQQYVETKQQLMLNLVQDLRRLDAEIASDPSDAKQAQKKATLDRLEQEAQSIPADQVPAPVRDTLGKNGRYL